MSKERELLERAYQYIPMSSVTSHEIRAYLAEPTQDEGPTLLTKEELGTIMLDWMNTPKSRDSDLYRAVQEEVLKKNGCPVPRPEFVRLSEEEVSEILSSAHTPYEAVCATENRLVEKNSINRSDPDSIALQSLEHGIRAYDQASR